MRLKIIAFILLAVFQLPVFAQHSSNALVEGPAELAGMSEKRIQLLDQFIQECVNKGYIPGGVFLIARDNTIVYNKSFGFRSADKKTPYQKDDIFRIASMTKAITTVAVMQLYEQGKGLSSKSSGTFEWGGYFNTKFFIDPKESLIFVGMTQIVGARHGEFWDRLTAILYSALED